MEKFFLHLQRLYQFGLMISQNGGHVNMRKHSAGQSLNRFVPGGYRILFRPLSTAEKSLFSQMATTPQPHCLRCLPYVSLYSCGTLSLVPLRNGSVMRHLKVSILQADAKHLFLAGMPCLQVHLQARHFR